MFNDYEKSVFIKQNSEFAKLVNGKKVIIVGPSSNVIKEIKEIDKNRYDFVVFLNNHEIPGLKPNIIYVCLKWNNLAYNFP